MGPRKLRCRGPKPAQGLPAKGSRHGRESERETKRNKRASDNQIADEIATCSKRARPAELSKFVRDFHSAIQDYPNHVCVCCGGLFYKESVSIKSIEWIEERLLHSKSKVTPEEYVQFIASLLKNEVVYLCSYCRDNIAKYKLPVLSIYNGLGFPELPAFIANLSDTQEKLLAPRIEFMRVQRLSKGGQKSLLGNIVNVEHNIDTSVQVIPRQFHELCVVNVELMRRSQYKEPFARERILPAELLKAAEYLVETPVYKDLNIKLSDEWIRHKNDGYLEVPSIRAQKFQGEKRTNLRQMNDKLAIAVGSDEDSADSSDQDSSGEDDIEAQPSCSSKLAGVHQHLDDTEAESCEECLDQSKNVECSDSDEEVDSEDFSHADARFCAENESLMMDLNSQPPTVRLTPCEDGRVIPLTFDKDPDLLCFPSIYGGQYRAIKSKKKPSLKKTKKFELRFHKRLPRPCVFLFHAFKMCYNTDIYNCVRVLLRKQSGENCITASQAVNPEFLRSVFLDDRGYSAFKLVRCTPAFWQAQGKKAVAMGRQFGKATFFITLSAAENRWADLIVALMDVVRHVKLNYEEVVKWLESSDDQKPDIGLSPGLIYELITSDPVTCIRHFHKRFRLFQKHVLKPENGVFGASKVEDFFWRVEFQQRGSPHVHGVTWNRDAPVFSIDDSDSYENCAEYIDKYITTTRNCEEKLKHVMPYQIHKHSFTCKKNTKASCRFGFPRPPLPKTMILLPFSDESDSVIKKSKKCFERIQEFLEDLGRDFNEDLSFADFIHRINLSFEDYVLAVRSSILRPTAFPRRNVNSAWVNNYNEGILLSWRANMDIQYVIDGFATMRYIVGYMLKCENRLSKVLMKILKSYQLGEVSGYEKVKMIANAFTNQGCVTAQEAAQYVISLPCVYTSRTEIYISNNKPLERVRMLKKKAELEKLDPDSDDVLASNMILRYAARPPELEQVCLVEFAGFFELDKKSYVSSEDKDNDADADCDWSVDDDIAVTEEVASGKKAKRYVLQNKLGKVYRRSVCKVIRFRHYNKLSQVDSYFRSQVFLYHPWRNEDTEVWSLALDSMTDEMEKNINENQKFIYKDGYSENIGDILKAASEEHEVDYDNVFRDEYGVNASEDFETNEFGTMYQELSKSIREIELFEEGKYRSVMQTLNSKQRMFVLEFMTRLKNVDLRNEPFYAFLNGGAGVGKTHVIHAILQTYRRYQLKRPSENPDREWVIVAAYTGKAAFNIGGVTLHSAFRFDKNKVNRLEYSTLADPTKNELMNRFRELKLVIIDEVSLMSNYMLNVISARLKEIMGNNLDFGGVSMLVVGDLRQLPPVAAPHVFKPLIPLSKEASARVKYLPRDVTINALWKKFEFYKLTEIMRQKGDVDFINALNHMAIGRMSSKDVQLIRSREVDPSVIPFDTIRLFFKNEDCHEYNMSVYKRLNTEGVDSVALDEINGRIGPMQVKQCKDFAKNMNRHQSDGIPYIVHLKVGAAYFVTTNIDVSDGLFNGSTGMLKYIQYGSDVNGTKNPIRVWLDFDNPAIGRRARHNYNKQLPSGIQNTWVPIEKIHRNLSREKAYHNAQIIRHQFPLQGANGMTIHKSQGSTLGTVAVSCKRKLYRQLIYVACSRATSLKGLYIQDGIFRKPEPASKHDEVEVELNHLKDHPFVPSIRNYTMNNNSVVNIFFANITSFKPVVLDLEADTYLMKSDLIFLVEPRLLESDHVALRGYDINTRINCRTSRNSEGLLAFRSNEFNTGDLVFEFVHQDYEDSGHFIVGCWKIQSFFLYVFYRSPNYTLNKCKDYLLSIVSKPTQKQVIIGDINWNFGSIGNNSDISRRKFLCELGKLNYFSLIPFCNASTDHGTTIDVAFTNICKADGWFYELYFNYHKGICMTIPKRSDMCRTISELYREDDAHLD